MIVPFIKHACRILHPANASSISVSKMSTCDIKAINIPPFISFCPFFSVFLQQFTQFLFLIQNFQIFPASMHSLAITAARHLLQFLKGELSCPIALRCHSTINVFSAAL